MVFFPTDIKYYKQPRDIEYKQKICEHCGANNPCAMMRCYKCGRLL